MYFDVAGGAAHACFFVGMVGRVVHAFEIGPGGIFEFVGPLIIVFLVVDGEVDVQGLALLGAFDFGVLEPLVSGFELFELLVCILTNSFRI